MLNITSGKITRPQKVVIYGSEGIGKSTLASKFPDPLFIDTEGGSAQMDIRRLECPSTFDALVSLVYEVAKENNICKTLIIDTADWAEQMCITDVCKKFNKDGIEEFGYGKGYSYIAEEFVKLIDACTTVINSGINVVITAHAKMRKFEQPDEKGAYDRFEMKLTKQVAPLLKEWCDMLLFCNYKTYVISTDTKTKKVQGGNRVIYTSHHPCWDAKNRHNLPDEMDMSYENIAHIFTSATKQSVNTDKSEESAYEKVKALMERDNIPEKAIQEIVSKKGHYDYFTSVSGYSESFLNRWVIPNWDKIVELVNNAEN